MSEGSRHAADELIAMLWPNGDPPHEPQVYAVVDAARDARIAGMIRTTGLEQACLFSGELSPALAAAAPYLVHLAPGARFTHELFALGWVDNWCLLCIVPADVTLQRLRRHLRSFLRVRTEAGRKLLFRFYDPRVLRVYLPTCTRDEAEQFFGPVCSYLCPREGSAAALAFELKTDVVAGTGSAAVVRRFRPDTTPA